MQVKRSRSLAMVAVALDVVSTNVLFIVWQNQSAISSFTSQAGLDAFFTEVAM